MPNDMHESDSLPHLKPSDHITTFTLTNLHRQPNTINATSTSSNHDDMPPLTNAIQVLPPEGNEEEVEDIFASAPGLIFPDDTRNSHGDAGATIVYKSRRFGEIELKTADPVGEGERLLFGHYLWNAGIKLAGLVGEEDDEGENGAKWRIRGEDVLELGSGKGQHRPDYRYASYANDCGQVLDS